MLLSSNILLCVQPAGFFDKGLDVDNDSKPDALMFGLQAHPKKLLIYVSMVSAAKLAVFSYDNEGRLSVIRTVKNKGQLICWIKINKAGTRAYTTNNGDDKRPFNQTNIK